MKKTAMSLTFALATFSAFSLPLGAVASAEAGKAAEQIDFVGEEVKDDEIIDMRSDLNFKPDYAQLAKGKLQVASAVLSPEKLRASSFVAWDMNGFNTAVGAEEMIVLTKTAFVIPNTAPTYFRAENVMTEGFLKRMLADSSVSAINPANLTATCERNYYFLHKIVSGMQYGFYDYSGSAPSSLSTEMADKLVQIYNPGEKPVTISTVISRENAISFGSHGARTTNLYYRLSNGDTLHLSFKILTIKKEEKYSSFGWRMMSVWDKLVARVRNENIATTLTSLKKVRKYVTGKGSEN
jgi:hypothetical protein